MKKMIFILITTLFLPLMAIDFDGDGLDDIWEINNFEQFKCKECSHSTESNGLFGCAYFGVNKDEINGKYQDETRQGKDREVSNEDLRRKYGVHIPREGSMVSADRLLKDYVNNGRCTGLNA